MTVVPRASRVLAVWRAPSPKKKEGVGGGVVASCVCVPPGLILRDQMRGRQEAFAKRCR